MSSAICKLGRPRDRNTLSAATLLRLLVAYIQNPFFLCVCLTVFCSLLLLYLDNLTQMFPSIEYAVAEVFSQTLPPPPAFGQSVLTIRKVYSESRETLSDKDIENKSHRGSNNTPTPWRGSHATTISSRVIRHSQAHAHTHMEKASPTMSMSP